ncbi:MAG TPA: helix-turn-helix domain-containing protein [Rubrobacter sp.]|nr:helix-turn-helix domain-containing protein [Rubrobacter sp.]
MRILEGAIYTVDEVSDLLGIPRPTLYRYLREYSIPHLRKAGRISIPEDSFDRIREARDLHREGLGTESVRRQLREGSGPDTGDLDRRLDTLHETLESLRGDIKERPATDEVALSPTLRTILARQSLLMSAMFNLTEMVEDLLLASGKRRKPLFEDLRIGRQGTLPESPARDQIEIAGTVTANVVTGTVRRPIASRPASFGALGRRRRRGVLAIVAALLFAVCLAWGIPALIGTSEPSVPRVTEAADEPPAEPKAVATAGETTSADEATDQESARESNQDVSAGGSNPEGEVVPDVSGRSLEEAAGIISGAGFEISAIKTEASQEEPETIIGTEPSAGASARPGAPVILTMSGGPTGIPPGFQTTSASASAATSVSASTGYTN